MTTMRLAAILLLTALIPSLDKRRIIRTSSGGPLFYAAYANISPSTSSRGSRFNRHKRNKQGSSSSSDGLLTLGDLESMQQSNNSGGTFIPTDAILFGQQQQQQNYVHANNSNEEMESSSSHHHQIRRSLRRINLDLSGRVMCHVISPAKQNDDDDDNNSGSSRTAIETGSSSSSSLPLFQIRDDATTSSSSRFGSNNNKTLLRRRLKRHIIPHIYIGANYDLDEVWYGATRWIAKCSWQLPKITTTDGSGSRARQFVESIFFPTTKTTTTTTTTTKRLPWMLDLEREQGVFDHPDSTMRVGLVQRHCHPVIQRHNDDSNHQSHHHHHHYHPSTVQKLSVEYDSAKYSNNHHIDNASLLLALAPTISVNIQTPILHPRIELRTKKTWIVQTGGDKHGNYYGGAHYGSYSSPVERRFETIRDGYRGMVPRSQRNTNSINSSSSSTTAATTTTRVGKLQTYGRKLSNWLEEDGWMPKRVTTDLMGNFVSVNEVGFCCSEDNSIIIDGGDNNNEREEDSPPPTTTRKTTTSCRTFLPPINNMGIRLRLSKRIDWTSLGIFPWSSNNNNTNSSSNNRMMHSNQKNTPTRVQFDLCGLHKSGNSVSQIGCEFDPLHLGDTFKVVIGHDDVGAVG